jgi:hypothetical protein
MKMIKVSATTAKRRIIWKKTSLFPAAAGKGKNTWHRI